MTSNLSIVVADDHPVVLHGLAHILRSVPDFRVVALCADGHAALEAIRLWKPSIAVLDFFMPKLDALDILRRIDPRTPTRVLVLTASVSETEIDLARNRGASAVLYKDVATETLIRCVRTIGCGDDWHEYSASSRQCEPEQRPDIASRVVGLSRRENEVAHLVSMGLSNKEVGSRLSLTEGTVKIHLHNIYEKTGVPNRTALAAITPAGGTKSHIGT